MYVHNLKDGRMKCNQNILHFKLIQVSLFIRVEKEFNIL